MIRTPMYLINVNNHNLSEAFYKKVTKVVFSEPKDGEENFSIFFMDHDLGVQDSNLFIEDKTVVALALGYTEDCGFMMDGIVSNIIPDYPSDGTPTLEIKVKNVANVMDRVERHYRYNGKTYSDIAREIAKRYNLQIVVDNTKDLFNPSSNEGINQAGYSDWNFLQMLSAKIGYRVFIKQATLYFIKDVAHNKKESLQLDYRVGKCNLLEFKPNLSTTKNGKDMGMSNINVIDKGCITQDGSVLENNRPKPIPPATTTVNPTAPPAPKTGRIHNIVAGDCLRNLAQKYYGDGDKWRVIANANTKVKPPKWIIYDGDTLNIP